MTLVVVLGLLAWAALRWGPFQDQSAVGRGHAHAPAALEVPPWLEVRVVDDATGKPAARANVRVMDHGAGRGTPPVQTLTDDEGIARVRGRRPSGAFHLVAVSSDFRARALERKVLADVAPTAHVELRLQPDPAFESPGVQVAVRVVDAEGCGLPAVPVALFAGYASPLETWRRLDTSAARPTQIVDTDAYGVARFAGPLEGPVTVQARPADRAWATAHLRWPLRPDSNHAFRLVCAEEVPVEVRLIQPSLGEAPITAVSPLWFHPLDWSTAQPEAISERFTPVHGDRASVALPVHPSSPLDEPLDDGLAAGLPANLPRLGRQPAGLVMQAGADLTLFAGWPTDPGEGPVLVQVPGTTTFRLRVIRAGTGVTVDGARVHVRSETLHVAWDVGAASSAVTDLQGFVTVRCVPGLITDIVVEDPRGFEHRVPLATGKRPRAGGDGESAPEEPFYVEVPEVPPTVAGRVVMGPLGGSLEDAAPILVACLDPSTGALQRQLVESDGRYAFAVRSGSYCQIMARAAGWASDVESALHVDELELRPTNLVLGQVVDSTGTSVAHARVRAQGSYWREPELRLTGATGLGLQIGRSDAAGRFAIEMPGEDDLIHLEAGPATLLGRRESHIVSWSVDDMMLPRGRQDGGPLALTPRTDPGLRIVDVNGLPLPAIRSRVSYGPWWERSSWRPRPTDALGHVSIQEEAEGAVVALLEPDLVDVRGRWVFKAPKDNLDELTLRRVRDVKVLVVDSAGNTLPRFVMDVRPEVTADELSGPQDPRGTLLLTDDEGAITLRRVPAEVPVRIRSSDPEARDGAWLAPAESRTFRCEVNLLTPAELRRLARIDVELQELAGLDAALHPGRARRDEIRAELRAEQAQIRRHGLR
ncbi:MAG: hypothetical protein H6826_13830 [Planctomycetes bacterium]|nr:hypothetical protein [Planctomycetota bacterium]